MSPERRYEIGGVILLSLTALLFLALVTDGYRGDVQRPLDALSEVPNTLGAPGAMTAGVLTLLFGRSAHLLYLILGIWGCMLMRHAPLDRFLTRLAGLVLLLGATAVLLHVDGPLMHRTGIEATVSHTARVTASAELPVPMGGIFGGFFASLLLPWLGMVGTHIVAIALVLVGILLATEFLLYHVFVWLQDMGAVALRCLDKAGSGVTESFSGLFGGARPVSRPARTVAESDAPPVTITPDIVGAALGSIGHDPVAEPVAPVRINVAQQESPFNEVPETPHMETPRASLTEDLPDSPFAEVPEPTLEQLELAEAEDAEEEGAELPAPPQRPAIILSKVADLPPEQRLRRKTAFVDDLPPDYEYPRRYTRPPMDIFDYPPPRSDQDLSEQLLKTSVQLEEALATFNIEARVTEVTCGPTITRYEVEPAPGIKVSRFLALADDLALALKAHRVRIEAPIPGKGRVGIELPNHQCEAVMLRELMESRSFNHHKGRLRLALGKDITGEVLVADLAAMPHLLVAGATGAGKTVCVKTMIASLLCTFSPDELQVMFIDPKMVELSIFNDIPHLITPVVTDPKKAATSLRWLINEMEERYRLFTHLRVRNIEVYNESVENGEIEVEGTGEEAHDSVNVVRKLPYIMCIIDELADLMIQARADVEDAIARLAQLARAVGIHLIIATQRPSVDVLTGVIKANFPARISFQVSSKVDSRCILDQIGAERLIGRGDMLYLPAGQSKPTRIQGAFVSDEEMNSLIAYLKTQAPPQYRDEIARFGTEKENLEDLIDQDDDLLDDAVRVVLETGQASISMVQRRLRVGYTRAARLIDMMEIKGIVGPHVGSKAREILVQRPPSDEVA
jgi:DNA segregation ATPase FtsK/SpoIIIE-like protein